MFVFHQTNARFQSKLKFKTVISNQTSPFNWNTYKITVWCGAANVHYCWTSIKSGKWPKHLIFIFFPPLDRYRFHRMRIICSWCLIQHLFSKGDAKKKSNHYRFWMRVYAAMSVIKSQNQIYTMYVFISTTVSLHILLKDLCICAVVPMFEQHFNGYFWICLCARTHAATEENMKNMI